MPVIPNVPFHLNVPKVPQLFDQICVRVLSVVRIDTAVEDSVWCTDVPRTCSYVEGIHMQTTIYNATEDLGMEC